MPQGALTQRGRNVLDAMKMMGRPVTEDHLQKVVYQLELIGEGFGFRFEETPEGPYSQELHETLYGLVGKELLMRDLVTRKIEYRAWNLAEA